jgi:hypothetical protein
LQATNAAVRRSFALSESALMMSREPKRDAAGYEPEQARGERVRQRGRCDEVVNAAECEQQEYAQSIKPDHDNPFVLRIRSQRGHSFGHFQPRSS